MHAGKKANRRIKLPQLQHTACNYRDEENEREEAQVAPKALLLLLLFVVLHPKKRNASFPPAF